MNIDLEKDIVQSLSSLYPLQEFEEEAIDTVLNAIPKWIPVTEKLPETHESVLVWSNGYICNDMIVCPYDDKIWYRCGKIEDDDYWMPLSCLPEPYKGATT